MQMYQNQGNGRDIYQEVYAVALRCFIDLQNNQITS